MIDIADHPAPAHDPALVAIVLVEDDDPDDFDIAIVEDDADDEAVAARTEFSWTVRFTVSGTWVADGFDLDHERAMTMLRNDLSYAHEHEVSAQVLEAPPPAAIQAMQGERGDERSRGHRHPEQTGTSCRDPRGIMATSPPRADYETLATLLASLFEMSELRNLLRSKYPDVIAELSEHMTLVHFVHDAVRVLDRRGVLDEDFFSTLTRVRPRRRNDIIALASLWRSGREPLRARVDAVAPDRY